MFDTQTIDSLGTDLANVARNGLTLLAVSGLIPATVTNMEKALLAGNVSEDPAALAERIKEFRRERAILLELHELGHRFNKEQTR